MFKTWTHECLLSLLVWSLFLISLKESPKKRSTETGPHPGRLRACANTECNLFLIDHSRPGTAKWCSMFTCGNRMKVRAHAQRTRQQR
ncbi:CGNR zinc finger domain-containing protein [Brevibacterium marinum]|uniref:Putative RNA-binding Zn ribbon-like protein n=1 Tax=Brevibacterium marinum TaxID=418643 RepID=A0A846RP22_9MICO|nr:CGNR zinc finger domain-containing protein [Brevibacterium marinum]NJC55654.1 putative RNA-binding Zn ribbon-like protein [Brevibacterium marinum]